METITLPRVVNWPEISKLSRGEMLAHLIDRLVLVQGNAGNFSFFIQICMKRFFTFEPGENSPMNFWGRPVTEDIDLKR